MLAVEKRMYPLPGCSTQVSLNTYTTSRDVTPSFRSTVLSNILVYTLSC